MVSPNSIAGDTQTSVKLTRTFPVPRTTVFAAWTSTDHLKRWFGPDGFSIPEAKVEMKVGGAFDYCMRGPNAVEHWVHGRFLLVEPPERLVIEMDVQGPGGGIAFTALTTVTFEHSPGGTLLTVEQSYRESDASAAPMIAGAMEGWSQTLAHLATFLSESERTRPAVRTVVHDSFTLQRDYPASVDQVWAALTTEEGKSKWFVGPPGQWSLVERSMDIRPGGGERVVGKAATGRLTTFDATYLDIEPGERLVYAYQMWLDDQKISVSLATMELSEAHGGARLKVTEQGAFLDGYDDAGSRKSGTADLLDRIGRSLEA